MDEKSLAYYLAVAMGTPAAAARNALDGAADYAAPAAMPAPGTVVGGGVEKGEAFDIIIAADGKSTERKPKA